MFLTCSHGCSLCLFRLFRTARADIFPSGLPSLHSKLKVELVAHNRFWGPYTDYAVQNGGLYEWNIDGGRFSLPLTQRFWDDLFLNNTDWGLAVYEQDWLDTTWDNLQALQTNITLGRDWLLQMGRAAAAVGVNIQYAACSLTATQHQLTIATKAIASTDPLAGLLSFPPF